MLAVSLLWLAFAGSHIALAAKFLREPLVRKLGERGFLALFALVASIFFALLVYAYAREQHGGPTGPALGAHAVMRPLLAACIFFGLALMAASFAPKAYWRSPFMVLTNSVREPFGLERVTRHPFNTGLVLFAWAHVLLASHLVGAIFFGGFLLLAVAGATHQGVKLRRRRGDAYTRFLRETSAVPFLAVLQGRQRLALAEIPWLWLALGLGIAVVLWLLHDRIFVFDGALVSATVVLGSVLIGIRGLAVSSKSDLK